LIDISCNLAFHKRFKNVIVITFTSYCFSFRSLITSQENTNKFPKVRKQSATYSSLIFVVIISFITYSGKHLKNSKLHLNKLLLHLNNSKLHLNNLLLHLNNSKLHLNNLLLHLNYSKLHLNSLLLHLNNSKLHLNKLLLHLNNSKLHLTDSVATLNQYKAIFIYSNFAICPLNHLHDHPATTPGTTVCLKRGVLPSISSCIVI